MDFILETLGKIGFDWRMGLFNFINFLVVFWILKKFAFGPIMKVIDERQVKMKEGLDNYKKSKTELQMAERKAQELIDEAKVSANKVVEKSHDEAKAVADELKVQARKEIDTVVDQAKKGIAAERSEMQEALKKETVGLVILAAEKVLGETVDKEKNKKYINDVLNA